MKSLEKVISEFNIKGEVLSVAPFGTGLINDTYLVETFGDMPDYVLQRINHRVFKDVEGMQRNILAVTSHIRHKLEQACEKDIERKVLEFETVGKTGKSCLYDGENYWRLSRLIPGAVTLQEVTPITARYAGMAFGRFQGMLADIREELTESIPGFHNMELRLRQLREAVENDAVGRVADVSDLLDIISGHESWMCEAEKLHREDKLPKRICHCDTKVNNMLFDENGEVLCVIDLDTVMPSFVFSDYGDFLRTGACTTPEDEPDIEKIDFDMSIFKAFSEGYMSEAGKFLTKSEIEWLPDSVALFPYMQAVRFLTDYINGDIYYKISYPEHNLVRTRAQLRLFQCIESLMPGIRSYIRELASDI
ncbi:MAG: phosphotransferase [Muribaculaceae bacterium]|nr:phosphotransferase [Muribaculaceae bacterium]